MKSKTLTMAFVAPWLVCQGGVAFAASHGDALDACSNAVAAAIEEDQGVEPRVVLDPSSPRSNRRLSDLAVFHLDVSDPDTSAVIARFDCIVDRRARVERLRTLPLTAPPAAIRSEL